ncbi:B-cell lymphoma 3 protein homolog isoform X2 [Sinocyclocheilus grahami]|uniref:B-cell lymphoma 3 protein homolog isoform X2 n=1 Tax=Sinocyclocheilus grahami TaxID=75366 RepID=UPI0007AC7460|nr:PREDICTED: B-cell lymphoma 3 protein homolog isoform X2 [Sinocyclocheilus grahami]
MTMSGSNHTVRSVPLDLTNKTRERGSCAQTGDQGRPRPTPERQVEAAHKCRNGHGILPSEPRDCCDGSVSQTTQTDAVGDRENRTREGPKQTQTITPNAKCNNQTNAAGKPAVSSFSKLPPRKRPFPLDVDHHHSGPRNDPPSVAPKVLKNPEAQIDTDPQRIFSTFGDNPSVNDSRFVPHLTPYRCPYIQWPRQPPPLESTDRLLADIAEATRQDEDGDTPLHIAVVKENYQLVSWLIEIYRRAHKDLDIFNNLRQTPLHLAVITHQPILVKALLDAGADPGALDRYGQTALHLCCEHREVDCLSVILRHYPQNPSPHLEIRNYEGLTPLHLAVQNGDKKLAKILLKNGSEINAGDNKSGRSPLVHAVENNFTDMVIFLIESGCDVNTQSYSGNTALHSACGRGHIEIVRVLLKNGADSSLKNNHNDTAIMVAKNKKVSDVLRGRGTRSCTVKTSSNGSLSPGSSNHSPRMTPTFQRSASLSPVTPVLPQSQSVDSISECQSPMNSNEKTLQTLTLTHHNVTVDNRAGYGMALHHFPSYLLPSGYDPLGKPTVSHIQRRMLIADYPLYYPTGIQTSPYYSDAQIILLPSFPVPVTYGSPSQGAVSQSRPSSRSSDQSDMSTVSVNSEERGVS